MPKRKFECCQLKVNEEEGVIALGSIWAIVFVIAVFIYLPFLVLASITKFLRKIFLGGE